jgi:hypothetical protein
MKSKYIFGLVIGGTLLITTSCNDFLDYQPQGLLSSENVKSASAVESLVTAAYAGIGNDDMIGPMTSMWVYGSVRSDDAYKGGGGVSDVAEVDFYEHYNLTRPDLGLMHPFTWENFYKAISRANAALTSLNALTDAEFPLRKKARQAEMRFLRGHSHFMLKMLFKNVPYVDENLSSDDILKESNVRYNNDELWNKIGEDFQFAVDNLPQKQAQIGRANKMSAAAYLAKLRLFQAYEQDANHKVTGINKNRLQEVVTLAQQVISSGQYSLQPDFAENFIAETENGPESIFAIQYSINDGTAVGRISYVTGLITRTARRNMAAADFTSPARTWPILTKQTQTGYRKWMVSMIRMWISIPIRSIPAWTTPSESMVTRTNMTTPNR